MRYVHPDYEFYIETSEEGVNTLVIESPTAFRAIVSDIMAQIGGEEGQSVLSEGNVPLNMARHAELLMDPIGFDINQKALLTKIASTMEKSSQKSEHYADIAQLMAKIELIVDDLAFEYPCDSCRFLT